MTSIMCADATRESSRVALVTCAELPELEPDDRLLIPALGDLGVTATPAVWDDPAVDWAAYDLVVLRSTWDYPRRREEFVGWARTVPRLVNPAEVVAWNTDKSYLAELSAAGVPVVPTIPLPPGRVLPPGRLPFGRLPFGPLPFGREWTGGGFGGDVVIKPSVGAGSIDTGRYDLADPEHRRLAAALVHRLHSAGRAAMVQPYLPAVDSYGETALLFFGGSYSHAIRKGPLLSGPDRGAAGLYRAEETEPRTPTPDELAVAERALRAVPGGADRLLYARVDLIPGPGGEPLLVELELAEPSLFLGSADGAPGRLAALVAARL